MSDIREWLKALGLGKYADTFVENDVDLQALAHLDRDDLKEMGVSLGHRKVILAAIAKLNDDSEGANAPSVENSPGEAHEDFSAPRGPEAERRQLTVMFCDLVGSTALSQRLDPEDLREVLRRYQDTIASVVVRHDGYVANFLGDGVLVYFGWPHAHENQAAQAIRAGIAAIDAMSSLDTPGGGALQARVGIASGQVVVGDLSGKTARQSDAVIGETPNLAARLQSLAEPGQVVIDTLTRQLLRDAFDLVELGSQNLKGIDEAVPAWRVTGERQVEMRFEALKAGNTLPLVGREHEIALLCDRYRLATSGEGQVMLLCGEPGVGKSRIVIELRERLRGESYTPIRYFCSPFLANTAFHPIIAQLEHAAKLQRDDSTSAKLRKIEELLTIGTPADKHAVRLVADLLSIPDPSGERSNEHTPQQRKVKTFETLMHQVEALAARQPVLMTLEDAQWLDPTSAELFEQLIERMQNLSVFLIVTYRPPYSPAWFGYPHVTALTLNRLGRDQAQQLVCGAAGGRTLADEVTDQILAKADGVPLFIEELTKTIVESGLLRDVGDRYELDGPLPPLAVPATLQDSLVARLDRLSTAKEVAQIAACIGREVPFRLLRRIVRSDEPGLQAALDQLVKAELMLRRGIGDDAVYVFRHRLVQEAAHQTLLKSRRQILHAKVGRTLVDEMPEIGEATPEIIARHFTEAGLSETAIEFWLKAARSAAGKPAFKEALAHLDQAFQLLPKIENERDKIDREIELRLASGVALHATRGPVEEVREAYSRACALCQRLDDDRRLYTGLWGLWFNSEQRMNFDQAQDLATQLLDLAGREGNDELLLQAHHAAWTTYLYRGELDRCAEHAERGEKLYSVEQHHANSSVFSGHDAGVCCRYTAALASWLAGRADSALARAAESVNLAEQLAHPYSLALALTVSSLIRQCRGEVVETTALADRLRTVSEDHGIAVFRATADIMHGWGLSASGEPATGIEEICRGLDALKEMGAGLRRSYFLWLLADAQAMQQQNGLALETLDQASEFARENGEQWWQAEILRRRGDLLQHEALSRGPLPDALFQEALGIANQQGALALSLRAATSYGQFCISQGEERRAIELVEPVYNRISEGMDTADVRRAGALLNQINQMRNQS